LGSDVLRGINVLKWESCSNTEITPGNFITTKVTWIFSDPDTWNTTIGDKIQFPVEISIEGSNNLGLEWTETYSYSNYRPFLEVDPEIFEVYF
jgi:hypothetical protein